MLNSGDFSQDRTILKAIVSLFFNLDYKENLIIKRSGLISELLNNLFGESYDPRIVVELADNPYPIRQSVNIINQEFGYSDKLVLLLNIFYYSFVFKINKSVSACMDLVKIVDILQMNISMYDTIFDFLEGQLDKVEIDKDAFESSLNEAQFANYLIWSNQGGDVDIINKDNKLCFLKITEQYYYKIVLSNESSNGLLTNTVDGEKIQLKNLIVVTNELIGNLFNQKSNPTPELIEIEDISQGVFYRKQNHIYLLDNKNKKYRNILHNSKLCYMDDKISADAEFLGIHLFKQKSKAKNIAHILYLIDYGNEIIVTEKEIGKAIATITLTNGEVEIESFSDKLLVNNIGCDRKSKLKVNEDIISWKDNSYKLTSSGELITSNIYFNELSVNRVTHSFKDSKSLALSDVNFSLYNGELLAIMGPSGSGKTTLLKVLNGEMTADETDITIDGLDFKDNFDQIIKNVGYVPQSDLLFANLTVYQNIFYYAKIRSSGKMKGLILKNRIDSVLRKVSLYDKRNHIVGNEERKILSGGERRRLNIALELIFEPAIIILDEPTSGLSSKDSEQIISILKVLANNGKMILTTIHQPNPKIFVSFDKLLFLDKQGVVVFYGKSTDVFSYFDDELKQIIVGKEEILKKRDLLMADFIFDIIEYKGYPNESWGKKNKRFFPQEHWKTKRARYLIGDLINKSAKKSNNHEFRNQKRNSFNDNLKQFYFCLCRNIINTIFSKINIVMLLFVPFILSLACAFLLRSSDSAQYSFGTNSNIPIFNFISILVFIFLGMSGSLYDIQPEKLIIVREKKVGLLASNYLLAKILTLLAFTMIQTIIYTLVAQWILQFKGHFSIYFMILTISGFTGISFGLCASAYVPDKRGLLMSLPLVLIPMIIFGGAIIQFSKMNPKVIIFPQREVPEFCEFVPTKWLFESLTLKSVHDNKYSIELSRFDTLLSKSKSPYQVSLISDLKNDFMESRIRNEYINRQSENMVDEQYKKYLKKRGNYYLAAKYPLHNNEFETANLAIIMSLCISFIFLGLTLKKIKEF